ncbi:LCP family protein [Amycolatopsis sp. 195334CR]|uniref:LCP family protein n=1 Tax=Amycolatopsis sp. 195334CR TaxID=2814588 RepID=UPI001A8C7593|nr:LCP family protein [Amycolatopsis sp. 195334CR]MBN6038636.1 LCP family protein [Amycolatopsis sp. 195334CR]
MNEEQLIRQAIADEAARAVPAEEVLAGMRSRRERRPRRPVLPVVVAGLAAAAAVVVTVVVVQPSADPVAPVAAAPTGTDVLLVGTDENGHADAIVLSRLDADGVVRGVSLPRDTWTGQSKLNATYAERGIEGLTAAVEALTGVKPAHHAVVDMAGFARLSEAVGGVEVCLRNATSDPRTGASFPAGAQTLSGERALNFLRQRVGLPNGDLDRTTRQRAFLGSLVGKLSGAPADVAKLVQGNVRTDPAWDVGEFASRVRGAGDLAVMPTLGERQVNGMSVLEADPAAVKSFVDNLFRGVQGGGPESGPGTGPGGAAPCVN